MVAHDAPAATNTLGMIKQFHERCPQIRRPSSRYSSRKELAFDVLDSSFMVATAGGGCVRVCHGRLARVPWSPERHHCLRRHVLYCHAC